MPDVPIIAFSISLPPNIYLCEEEERQAPVEVDESGLVQLLVKPAEVVPGHHMVSGLSFARETLPSVEERFPKG